MRMAVDHGSRARRASCDCGDLASAMTDHRENEMRAILTRAADAEASRQRAERDRDWPRVAQLEAELRRLWRAHADLERQCA